MHRKMSVQQVWRFMRRIFQVHRKRMLYLSLPIDSVGHCIRYENIKVFSEPHFPIYGQNPRKYKRNYVSHIFPHILLSLKCFTKITHHWTRIIDILLKINNLKKFLFKILLSYFFKSWQFLTKKPQLLRTYSFVFSSIAQNISIFGS